MAEKLAELRKKGKKTKETVLWTNPSPTSNFAEQNIDLNSTVLGYDYIKIRYRQSAANAAEYSLIVPLAEYRASWESNTGNARAIVIFAVATTTNQVYSRRVFYRNVTSAKITDAILNGTTTLGNNLAIPLQIIGLK